MTEKIDLKFLQRRMAELSALEDSQTSSHEIYSGGDGGNGGMEARVAKIEAAVGHIESDIREIKTDLRALLIGLITAFLILGGMVIAGYLKISDQIVNLPVAIAAHNAQPPQMPHP